MSYFTLIQQVTRKHSRVFLLLARYKTSSPDTRSPLPLTHNIHRLCLKNATYRATTDIAIENPTKTTRFCARHIFIKSVQHTLTVETQNPFLRTSISRLSILAIALTDNHHHHKSSPTNNHYQTSSATLSTTTTTLSYHTKHVNQDVPPFYSLQQIRCPYPSYRRGKPGLPSRHWRDHIHHLR